MKHTDELFYRPYYHFTPKKNWMNDPNGMFYFNGKFHLYFQHNPNANVWGPMHWGHATSDDLKTWEEYPIALFPDALGTIFSGSAVVDLNNTSGLGTEENPPIVALFTYHDAEAEKTGSNRFQTQGLAYSLDEGYTWTKYAENPVIDNPGIQNFRDPKVIWMEQQQQWVMTLAAGQETQFYTSKNLLEWTYASSFGKGIGNHDGVWECPDLFPLKVQGTNQIKWVHLVSINPGGPNGGSATQYFVGDFNCNNFTVDPAFQKDLEKSHTFWTDFGKDNYAGVTFSNWKTENGNVLFLGWMSNWEYANSVPTTLWRSAMTSARELELIPTKTSYRLRSKAPKEWGSYIQSRKTLERIQFTEKKVTLIPPGSENLVASVIDMELSELQSETYFFVLSNAEGEELVFGLDQEKRQFFIDRSKAGRIEFSTSFASKYSWAPRFKNSNQLHLTALLDKTSIELFFDDGLTVMTEIFFIKTPFDALTVFSDGKGAELSRFEIIRLKQ